MYFPVECYICQKQSLIETASPSEKEVEAAAGKRGFRDVLVGRFPKWICDECDRTAHKGERDEDIAWELLSYNVRRDIIFGARSFYNATRNWPTQVLLGLREYIALVAEFEEMRNKGGSLGRVFAFGEVSNDIRAISLEMVTDSLMWLHLVVVPGFRRDDRCYQVSNLQVAINLYHHKKKGPGHYINSPAEGIRDGYPDKRRKLAELSFFRREESKW